MSYQVPSMDDIRATPWNGLNVVSTFSGCGGSSLGYRMAGCRVLAASEFVPAAADVYELNAADYTTVLRSDVRETTGQDLLDAAGVDVGALDILDGSPPCSSFSMAGKREAGWGDVSSYSDTAQRTDDLFFEFARLVDEIQPRVFVAENVAGLTRGTAKGYLKAIHARLTAAGYTVGMRLLDAQWLGVPQRRVRLIFVGTRNDLELEPTHPSPQSPRFTIADALPHLAGQVATRKIARTAGWADAAGWSDADRDVAATFGTQPNSGNGRFPTNVVGHRIVGLTDREFGNPIRIRSLDHPSPTVNVSGIGGAQRTDVCLAGCSRDLVDVSQLPTLLDPETGYDLMTVSPRLRNQYPRRFLRRLSIGELRRLCGFPDDFALAGTYAQRWERLGRAVPPPMMRAVAEQICLQLTE